MSDLATPEVVAPAPTAPGEPWRRRVLRALLYGKADRHAKARGRIGLTMIAFTVVYAVIAGRLIVYAVTPDSHVARRGNASATNSGLNVAINATAHSQADGASSAPLSERESTISFVRSSADVACC